MESQINSRRKKVKLSVLVGLSFGIVCLLWLMINGLQTISFTVWDIDRMIHSFFYILLPFVLLLGGLYGIVNLVFLVESVDQKEDCFILRFDLFPSYKISKDTKINPYKVRSISEGDSAVIAWLFIRWPELFIISSEAKGGTEVIQQINGVRLD